MSGHSWTVILTKGERYTVVTKSNNEESARELYRKSLGSRNEIWECRYEKLVHAVQE